MTKLKVYGGNECHPSTRKQGRVIVAAETMKAAWKALSAKGYRMSYHQMAKYWSESSNTEEITLATSKPGEVFHATSNFTNDFKQV